MTQVLVRFFLTLTIVVQFLQTATGASTNAACANPYCAYLPSVQIPPLFRIRTKYLVLPHTGPIEARGDLINTGTQAYSNIRLEARLLDQLQQFTGITLTGFVANPILLPGQVGFYIISQSNGSVPSNNVKGFEVEVISQTVVTVPTYQRLDVSITSIRPGPEAHLVTFAIRNNHPAKVYNAKLHAWSPEISAFEYLSYYNISLPDLQPSEVITEEVGFLYDLSIDSFNGSAEGILSP